MRKLLFTIGVLLTLTSCAPQAQLISETPRTTRKAIVYEDKVIVVTETTITREKFDEVMAKRKKEGAN